MSHHTHVILSNEENAKASMSWVNSCLDDMMLYSNNVDGCRIIGALNLTTGEFTPDEYYSHGYVYEPTTIAKLEEYANGLFSKGQWTYLENELNRAIKNNNYFKASILCRQLDGMKDAILAGGKWSAKNPFPINDGYLEFHGITDWCGDWDYHAMDGKAPDIYAVLVDFHS